MGQRRGAQTSAIDVLVIPSNEEAMIARVTVKLAKTAQ
jgi:acetate kinase